MHNMMSRCHQAPSNGHHEPILAANSSGSKFQIVNRMVAEAPFWAPQIINWAEQVYIMIRSNLQIHGIATAWNWFYIQ